MLYIQIKNQGAKAKLYIRNTQGSNLFSSEFYLSHQINLEQINLSSGLYFIEVKLENEILRDKFIYEN
jgi:hypothetical protein